PLGVLPLRVKTPKRAADRTRMVVLDEGAGNACLRVALRLVGLQEEAAIVAKDFGRDDDHVRNLGTFDLHGRSSSQRRSWNGVPANVSPILSAANAASERVSGGRER